MKISKYITAVILLAVATLLLVIFNTDNFPHSIPNSYRLYVKDSTISLEEIDAAARAKNAVFFAITSNEINLQKEESSSQQITVSFPSMSLTVPVLSPRKSFRTASVLSGAAKIVHSSF